VAAGADDSTIGFWSVPIASGAASLSPPLTITQDGVDDIAFAPDGRSIVMGVGFFTTEVGIWDVASRANIGVHGVDYEPISVASPRRARRSPSVRSTAARS
jgi:hypothetical protein